MKKQLKEKEQLSRISTLKLSELKRSIRHNSLNPLKPPSEAAEGSILSGQSPDHASSKGEVGRRAPLPNRNTNTSRHSLAPLGSRKLPGVKTAITTAKKGSSTVIDSVKKSTKTTKILPPSGK